MQQYGILCLCISPANAEALQHYVCDTKKQSMFDCLLSQQQSCQKLSKPIHVCQTNSMTNYLHFFETPCSYVAW